MPCCCVAVGGAAKRQLGEQRTTKDLAQYRTNGAGCCYPEYERFLEESLRHAGRISELNALNAYLAVSRFKQLRDFYLEEAPLYNLPFGIGDMKIVSEPDLP